MRRVKPINVECHRKRQGRVGQGIEVRTKELRPLGPRERKWLLDSDSDTVRHERHRADATAPHGARKMAERS